MTGASDPATVAARLTEAQRKALKRLCENYVYVDGRSLAALVRKGLAKGHGTACDPMLGTFQICTATPEGLAVRHELEGNAP